MKYAVAVIVSAALGGIIGLLAAWGAVAYTPPGDTTRGGGGGAMAAPMFVLLPACGAAGGLVVGLVVVAVAHRLSRRDTPASAEPGAAPDRGRI